MITHLQKCSLIDYPGKIAAIVFTQGCPWNCPFCHNKALREITQLKPKISENEVIEFLKTRKGKLDGIVVTGGEPSIHKKLPLFLEKIKKLGFLVKLDTNGVSPLILESLIKEKLVDFLAMDIKSSLENYSKLAGCSIKAENILKSIKLIQKSDLPHEFRTTYVPALHIPEDIFKISELLLKSDTYGLQKFIHRDSINDKSLSNQKVDNAVYDSFINHFNRLKIPFSIR